MTNQEPKPTTESVTRQLACGEPTGSSLILASLELIPFALKLAPSAAYLESLPSLRDGGGCLKCWMKVLLVFISEGFLVFLPHDFKALYKLRRHKEHAKMVIPEFCTPHTKRHKIRKDLTDLIRALVLFKRTTTSPSFLIHTLR